MTRDEAIETLECKEEVENMHLKSPLVRVAMWEAIERLKEPITLAEFLGWEEGVEYVLGLGRFKILDDILFLFSNSSNRWEKSYYYLIDYKELKHASLRQIGEIELKYYAKIKGWELLTNENIFLAYHKPSKCLSLQDKDCSISPDFIVTNTLGGWKILGINDTNADFERVVE